jgi:hypothetical protein
MQERGKNKLVYKKSTEYFLFTASEALFSWKAKKSNFG